MVEYFLLKITEGESEEQFFFFYQFISIILIKFIIFPEIRCHGDRILYFMTDDF